MNVGIHRVGRLRNGSSLMSSFILYWHCKTGEYRFGERRNQSSLVAKAVTSWIVRTMIRCFSKKMALLSKRNDQGRMREVKSVLRVVCPSYRDQFSLVSTLEEVDNHPNILTMALHFYLLALSFVIHCLLSIDDYHSVLTFSKRQLILLRSKSCVT